MFKIYVRQLFVAIVALLCSVVASAHDFEVDGIYYNVIDDTKLTVEVSYYWDYYGGYHVSYSRSVVIPSTVNYNGRNFSVTSIGDSAFYKCSGLTSVEIPNSVTSIGIFAFYKCKGLTSIEIPNSVTSIGGRAFEDCDSLINIKVYENIKNLSWRLFDDTMWYNNQPDGVVYIDNMLYGYKGKMPQGTSIVVNEGTLVILGSAFFDCSGLTSIEIPNSVTSIGGDAFAGCKGLTSIEIPNSVTSIGELAFGNCNSLTSIEIPNSVTSIGERAFFGCKGLTNIEIPNSVTSIGKEVFYGCGGLTSIEIPNSVTSIGEYAFFSCYRLTSIEIPNSVTNIGDSAFYTCGGITSIEIPNSVTSIGEGVFFNCSGLTSIKIPNSVTSIGERTFEGCKGLTSIEIPNSVTSIGKSAFSGCKGLTSVISNIPGDKLFAIDKSVFYTIDKDNCTLSVPAGSKEVYASTSYWSEFKNIVEFDPTAIDNVADDAPAFEFTQNGILLTAADSKSVAVYTVSGALVTKIASYTGEEIVLDKGTYVVRVGGKAVKVQL